MKPQLAFLWMAACVSLAWAQGTQPADNRACPAPAEVLPVHLYGLWRVEFQGAPDATVLFERNRERQDSVFGAVNRGGVQALLAGDVEDGDLQLDESADGQRISALWSGLVVAGSCGKEISGTWRNASDNTERRFVLRKLPGWQ